ncbi:unnamed protein product, partial [Rotaria magnacalcarata]
IISSIPYNETILISYETTETPFIITQFEIEDRDLFQLNLFSYSFTVTPSLDLSLTNNGTLILRTMPLNLGSYI